MDGVSRGARGRFAIPAELNQAFELHNAPGLEQKNPENKAITALSKLELSALSPHLKRSQHPEFDMRRVVFQVGPVLA